MNKQFQDKPTVEQNNGDELKNDSPIEQKCDKCGLLLNGFTGTICESAPGNCPYYGIENVVG